MRRFRALVLAVALPSLLAAAGAPSATGAGWAEQEPVVTSTGVLEGALTVAPDGRAVAGWIDRAGDAPAFAERPPHGAWGPPARADNPAAGVPTLAGTVDATTAGWMRDGVVGAATTAPGAPFGAAWLGVSGPHPPVLASSPDGWTIAAWSVTARDERPAGLFVSERPPGGTFEEPAFFAGEHGGLSAAVSTGGRAAVAWTIPEGETSVLAAVRDGGSAAWSAAERVGAGNTVYPPAVGVDGRGDVVVTWLRGGGRPWLAVGEVVAADRRDGRWTDGQVLGLTAGARPQLTVNVAGDAVASWLDGPMLRVTRRSPGAPFAAPVSPPRSCLGQGPSLPARLDAAGNAFVVYPSRYGNDVGAVVLGADGVLHELDPIVGASALSLTPFGTGIDAAGMGTMLLSSRGSGTSSLRSVTTSAPIAELAATLPAVAPEDCVLPPGSRPVTPAPLPAAAAPALRLLATHPLKLRSGSLRVPVRCPASGRSCTGTLTVRAGGRQVGSAPFTLRAGSIRTLAVRVKSAKRPRSVQLRAVTAVTGGPSATSRATLSVRR